VIFLKESHAHQPKWGFKSIFREGKGDFGPASRERDVVKANESL
jgi:hypothetical protein